MRKTKTYGLFIGKFLPPHLGHVNAILNCSKRCDKLFVIVADSEARSKKLCAEAELNYIPPKLRFCWMKEIFKDNKNITVLKMNQGMLEAFPDNLESWKKKLFKLVKHKNAVWFVDKNYFDISHKVFPEIHFESFDRSIISISASQIRMEPKKFLSSVPEVVCKYFKNHYNL